MKYECIKCGEDSNKKSLFVKRSDRPGKVRNICIRCHNERQKKYIKSSRNKKRDALNALKDVPCKDCGGSFPPYVMDFDHLGDKKFGIADGMTIFTLDELLEEVKKCDVVCSNCHRIRTHSRNQYASRPTAQARGRS